MRLLIGSTGRDRARSLWQPQESRATIEIAIGEASILQCASGSPPNEAVRSICGCITRRRSSSRKSISTWRAGDIGRALRHPAPAARTKEAMTLSELSRSLSASPAT